MFIKLKTIFMLLIFFLLSTIAYAGKGGKPSDSFLQQIDELRLRIEILEQASRGINVYDNNGQYLGLLVDVNSIAPGGIITTYVPSVQSALTLQNSTGDLGGDPHIYISKRPVA